MYITCELISTLKALFDWEERKIGRIEKWENKKYLCFSSCVFGWKSGKVEKWNDRKDSL